MQHRQPAAVLGSLDAHEHLGACGRRAAGPASRDAAIEPFRDHAVDTAAIVNDWIATTAAAIARHAERELDALVAVSSPSGDVHGAEEAVRVATAFLPDEAEPSGSPARPRATRDDLLARIRGTGDKRLLLIGHLDTVHAHEAHKPPAREGDKLIGSGAVDMKGGDVLALGVLRALVPLAEHYAEVALLFVNDEEWRVGELKHAPDFEGWDACLCFEAGQTGADGDDEVIVKRKAAATLRVEAFGAVVALRVRRPTRAATRCWRWPRRRRPWPRCHDPAGPGPAERRAHDHAVGRGVQRRARRRRAVLRRARRPAGRVRAGARGGAAGGGRRDAARRAGAPVAGHGRARGDGAAAGRGRVAPGSADRTAASAAGRATRRTCRSTCR